MSMRDRIKQAREAAGLSKSELARRCGVTPTSAIDWEREGGTKPSVEKMERIALETGASFEWLATGRGQMLFSVDRIAESSDAYLSRSPAAQREASLIAAYRKLPDAARERLLDLLEVLPTHIPPQS